MTNYGIAYQANYDIIHFIALFLSFLCRNTRNFSLFLVSFNDQSTNGSRK